MSSQDYKIGHGTKVFMKDKQVVIALPGSGYEPGADEAEIHNIAAIDIRIRPDEIVSAAIKLVAISEKVLLAGEPKFVIDVTGLNAKDGYRKFHIGNPLSDEVKQVKKIEFADGSTWEAS